jgi:hypothetical protein
MKQFARVPGKYSLVTAVDPGVEDFTFDSSNQASYRKQLWASYDVFPLGGSDRRYLSAHSSVCECPGGECESEIAVVNSESAVAGNTASASGASRVDSSAVAKLGMTLSMLMAIAM